MKVFICVEFTNIDSLDSEEATLVIDELTAETVTMSAQSGAAVWVDSVEES